MAAQKALTGDSNDDTSTEDKEKDNEDGWTEHQEVSSIYIRRFWKSYLIYRKCNYYFLLTETRPLNYNKN